MTRIVVVGGTGYAGSAIVREAAERGFEVVSVSRREPGETIPDVKSIVGSVQDKTIRDEAFEGADVIVAALSPRGDMTGKLGELYTEIAQDAAIRNARFIVIGGFGSLRPVEGGPRFVDSNEFPADYRGEALELAGVLDYLSSTSPENLDWLYVSPAQEFGAYNPGERTGKYRIGGAIALFDSTGRSQLSSQDLAVALTDEIEKPAHHKEHISVVS